MSRVLTLPTGVKTVAESTQYRAVHALEILYSTPVRVTDGPAAVTIDSNSYSTWHFDFSEIDIADGSAGLSLRLSNLDQSISTLDVAQDSRGKVVKVYEVHYDSTETQLGAVELYHGIITSVLWNEAFVDFEVRIQPASASGMACKIASRLCTHTFKGLRCGYAEIAAPTFARATTAFDIDGVSHASGAPRYDHVRCDDGIMLEVGTSNLLTANQGSVETDTTGFTASGSTITRSNEQAWTGTYSLKIVTDDSATEEGAYTANTTTNDSVTHWASCWVRGSGTVKIGLNERTAADADVGTTYSDPITLSSTWQRLEVGRTFGATGERARVYLVTDPQQSVTFYADGWQLEEQEFPTSWHTGGATRNDDVLTVPAGALDATSGSFSCWFKLNTPPGYAGQYLLDIDGAANESLVIFVAASGGDGFLTVDYGTGAATVSLASAAALAVDTVYHVLVTWSSSGVLVYQDGSLVAYNITDAPGFTAGTDLYLGSTNAGTNFLNGWMDDVVFHSSVRTSAEADLFGGSVGPWVMDSSTMYYLPFDGTLEHAEGPTSTECSKTYTRCTALSNTARFGGVAYLAPRQGQRISYRIVSDAPPSQRAGSASPPPTPAVTPTAPPSIRRRIYSTGPTTATSTRPPIRGRL